jgi:hypothetical protein
MPALRCRVEIVRGITHTRQTLAGFLLLKQAGAIDLEIIQRRRRPESWAHIVAATVNDSIHIGYDLQDAILRPNSDEHRDYFDSVEHLFVRSYTPGSYGHWEHKVHPYGINYPVGVRHPVSVLASYAGLEDAARRLIKRALRHEPSLAVKTFEAPPRRPNGGPILLLCRLWDPSARYDEFTPNDVETLNNSRVHWYGSCARHLAQGLLVDFRRPNSQPRISLVMSRTRR